MKKIRVDFCTGTGGSKLVAELAAEKLRKSNVIVEINRIIRVETTQSKEVKED